VAEVATVAAAAEGIVFGSGQNFGTSTGSRFARQGAGRSTFLA